MKAAFGILVVAVAAAQVQVAPPQVQFASAPRPDIPAQTGKGTIEGTVTDSVTHSPIRKATVMLNGRTSLRAVTDVDGHFAFRQLPAGPYSLQAQAERYPNPGQPRFDAANQVSVSISGDEQKNDVALSLTPGASLQGHIVDEEGSPMPQCSVSPTRLRNTSAGRALADANSGQSDDKGEYRIENLPAGKYYVMARCFQGIPMPHAFIRRDALAVIPMLTYTPLFYPASADLSGASRVTLAPGTTVAGIDFRMVPATGVPVRGRVQPVPTGTNLQISLRPKDPLLRRLQQGARVNPETGEFQIASVRPGSYELIAMTRGGQSYTASVPVDVGEATPEPIELRLTPTPQITGSITVEGGLNVPLKNLRLIMSPVDDVPAAPPPQAEVQNDGTFITSAPPGRWRVRVNGAPGFVKSIAAGDQEISGSIVEIGAAPVSLKIVISTKTSQVDGTVAGLPSTPNSVFAIVWSPDSDFQQTFPIPAQGPLTFNLPPGKYHTCAIGVVQPFMVLQDRALKNVLASRCATMEASEGSHTSVQVPFIPTEELKRLADKVDEDDPATF